MEFRILGPLEIERDGKTVDLRAPKLRSLLAVLVLHAGEVVSYERLFDGLWGDEPPATARTTLQVYVSGLRKGLGVERIVSHPRGYLLHAEPEEVDARRFERLVEDAREQAKAGAHGVASERYREALSLWRGPALGDVSLELFARGEAERLQELRVAALEEQIDCDLELGHGGDLVGELEAVVGEHPLHERFRAQLMLALYRQGRQADALEAYREARRTLVNGLGIEPGPELRELNRRILDQDPALTPVAAARLPGGTVTLLATDVEGSTQLLQELGPVYREVLADEQGLLQAAFTLHGGQEVDSQGESFLYVFTRATDAVLAAAEAQRALADHLWPGGIDIRVRMGIHTGEPSPVGNRFVGLDVHRVARICSAGHGGQVLLSQETRDLVKELPAGISTRGLGAHRLKDLREPERLFQLSVPGLADAFPPLRSLHATNIPIPTSSFVGREQELADLCALLLDPDVRLVTLTGPGGSGKTRLAFEAAATLVPEFRDGAVVVSLAPISDSALVLPTIAETLGVRQVSGEAITDTISVALADKDMLLVLDNFEHVLDAAPDVAELLQRAPSLTILATSRETLRVTAERVYDVPPLVVPDLDAAPDPEELGRCDAVALFVDRARAVSPHFQLDVDNADSVAEVCIRLDGLPLAIELAAARTNILQPSALVQRLGDRLKLLSAGARDRPARHRTLHATIAWSERLLDDSERALFRRLSVFAGGWSIDGAEAVCVLGEAIDVFEALTSLVEKSLVRPMEEHVDPPRFSMLESIREYAAKQLSDADEREHVRRAHAEYYATLGRQFDEELWWGPPEANVQDELACEIDNFRAALDWARDVESDLELPLAIAYQLSTRVLPDEGRRVLEEALARRDGQPTRDRARALAAAGGLAGMLGDSRAGNAMLEESLALYRALDDPRWTFGVLSRLSLTTFQSGDVERARELVEEAKEMSRRASLQGPGWVTSIDIARALINNDFEQWKALLAQSIARRGAAGDLDEVARRTSILGYATLFGGEIGQALAIFEDAMGLARSRGYPRVVFSATSGLAAGIAASGELRVAVKIFAAIEAWAEAHGFNRDPNDPHEQRAFGALKAAYEDQAYADEADAGRAMRLEAAADLALETARRVRERSSVVAAPTDERL